MTLKQRDASAREDIVNARYSVRAGGGKFVPCTIKAGVEHLVVVASESFDCLAATDVPKLAGTVDATSEAVVACEVKRTARKLTCMTL